MEIDWKLNQIEPQKTNDFCSGLSHNKEHATFVAGSCTSLFFKPCSFTVLIDFNSKLQQRNGEKTLSLWGKRHLHGAVDR